MKGSSVMENPVDGSKSRSTRTTVVIVLAFIIGLLIGLMFHDTLIQHLPRQFDIKSWYPR
jgi:undecaprenyl pyrophosphate phosphatase UppP